MRSPFGQSKLSEKNVDGNSVEHVDSKSMGDIVGKDSI